jgi:peroxiredoxin
MRLLTRARLSVLLIVVALVAINVVAFRWSSHFFPAKRTENALLRYGDRLAKLKARSLNGKGTVELPAKRPTNLLFYFSFSTAPGFSTELVKYAETVSRTHKKDGLGITAVVQKDITELKTLLDHSLIDYDVIVDDDQEIQNQLGLHDGENGVFIFDQQGVCRFSTRRPVSVGDLRQLVTMEFLKVDPFEKPAPVKSILKEGNSLGSWTLLDARSLEPTSMDQVRAKINTPMHYVFFTAECSVCSLPSYLEEFRKFRRDQLKDDESRAVLMFDYNFGRSDVMEQLQLNEIHSTAYIANEPLPALEFSEADDDARREKIVALVEADARGTVVHISPLHLEDDGSPEPPIKPPSTTGVVYEQVFQNIPFTASDLVSYHGRYFVTDSEGNRILVINDRMELERDFGRIGSGPGRLFHPSFLDVGPDGTIFVEDSGNERIVKFDQAGNYLGELRLPAHLGLAVGAQNELYLGDPYEGHLVSVYSSDGKKLRSFGQLKKFSDVYGPAFSDKDAPYTIAFNRVRLSTDKERNVYVSFMLTPLVQKYSPDGTLLFERRLEDPEIDRLMEAIQKTKYISTRGDGADARIVALDPVIDPANGNIMVPLVDGSIYVADREGRKITLLHPALASKRTSLFRPFVASLGANGELLVTRFPPKNWYRLVMPTDVTQRRT